MHARVMSLGEIVEPNMIKAVKALAEKIEAKQTAVSIEAEKKEVKVENEVKSEPTSVIAKVGKVAHKMAPMIDAFKMGKLSEREFNEVVIKELKDETGIQLTDVEFDDAWNSMNPNFDTYAKHLADAIAYNKIPGNQMVLLSFTNPKDMRYLMKQLANNAINYQVDENGHLCEIAGIPVKLTYVAQKRKAELLKDVIEDLQKSRAAAIRGQSISTSVFGMLKPEVKLDIGYVLGTNKIAEALAAQREAFAKDSAEAQKAAEDMRVNTCLWDKKTSLIDTLTKSIAEYSPQLISAL